MQNMIDNMDLEYKMQEAIEKGGLEELVKLNMRHCVTQCSVACGIRSQHEDRMASIEQKLSETISNQRQANSISNIINRFPRWTYPVIFIAAVCAGLSAPVVFTLYMVLVSKGIMPKLW